MLFHTYEFKTIKRFKYFRKLLVPLVKKSGRDVRGQIVMFSRGGGFKRYYRLIDFKRIVFDMPGKVTRFEYDPNRSTFIMLVVYINGIIAYYLAPTLLKVGKFIMNGRSVNPVVGNSLPLFNVGVGSFVHCVKVGAIKAVVGRSAGTSVQVIRKFGSLVLLRFPSKEERFIYSFNYCVLGRISFDQRKLIKKTSAGLNRRLGLRPHVRGVAKNPIDHPHGGGEGRTSGGQPSVSPWYIYTKGVRTTTRWNRFNLYRWGFFRRRSGVVW